MSDQTSIDRDRAAGTPPEPDPGAAVSPPSAPDGPGPQATPPYVPTTGPAVPGAPGVTGPPTRESMAVISLVCSLVGILVGLAAILGIVFGFRARSRIRASAGTKSGSGLALAAIIIGAVALAGNLVIVSVVLAHTTTSSPAVATSAFAGNPTAADTALAQSEALPASDYPSGFSARGPSSTNPTGGFYGGYSDTQVRAMAACLGTPTTAVDTNSAESAGQKYADQGGDNILENIEVYPTTANAVADVTALASPRAPSCWLRFNSGFGASIAKGVGNGATAGATTAVALAVPPVGDHAAGMQVVVTVTNQGGPVTITIDLVAIQKGRSEVLMLVGGGPASDTQSLATLEAAAAAHLTT